MKKALSIFMLFIFLFNVGGYYIVFWVLQHQYDQKIASIIDSGAFIEEETVELKIPMALPYPLQPRDFERISGNFEYNGEYYELVQQKLENDTLRIICLKNHDQKHLVSTMNNYTKLSNDLPGSEQKAYNFLGKLVKEYNAVSKSSVVEATSWHLTETRFSSFNSPSILASCLEIPSPPPKA